jgi:hypothetical protein
MGSTPWYWETPGPPADGTRRREDPVCLSDRPIAVIFDPATNTIHWRLEDGQITNRATVFRMTGHWLKDRYPWWDGRSGPKAKTFFCVSYEIAGHYIRDASLFPNTGTGIAYTNLEALPPIWRSSFEIRRQLNEALREEGWETNAFVRYWLGPNPLKQARGTAAPAQGSGRTGGAALGRESSMHATDSATGQ